MNTIKKWFGRFTEWLNKQRGIINIANAWPTTGAGSLASGYIGSGVTTIFWGTEGVLQSPKPSSGFYTVLRANQKTIVDNQKLPQGDGLTTTDIGIVDGHSWELTVRDDTQMTPPQVWDSVTVIDIGGVIAGTASSLGAHKAYAGRVKDANYDSAVRQAGERVLLIERLTLIDTGSALTQV